MPATPADTRKLLMSMYEAAVQTAHPKFCVPPHLPEPPAGSKITLSCCGNC